MFERQSTESRREIEAYDRLNKANSTHAGAMLVRTALDNFQIGLADAHYPCLVQKPLGISLYDLRNRFAAKVLLEKNTQIDFAPYPTCPGFSAHGS